MITIDANVFIYSFDDSVSNKHAQAAGLFDEGHTPCLMCQVACETLAWLRRRKSEGRFSTEDVVTRFRALRDAYPLTYPDNRVFELSFELLARYSLSHWDSLLLAACIFAGVDTLYSEDMAHGMTYDTVTVLNPFQAA